MKLFTWGRMHGGVTHFPIALLVAAVIFDAIGLLLRGSPRARELHAGALYSLILASLISFIAILTGMGASGWITTGGGLLLSHHVCIWPGYGLLIGLTVWRSMVEDAATSRWFTIFLALEVIAAGLMLAGGYFGGEMLFNGAGQSP